MGIGVSLLTPNGRCEGKVQRGGKKESGGVCSSEEGKMSLEGGGRSVQRRSSPLGRGFLGVRRREKGHLPLNYYI